MKAYKQAAHANMVNNQAEVQVHANDAMVSEDVTMAGQFKHKTTTQNSKLVDIEQTDYIQSWCQLWERRKGFPCPSHLPEWTTLVWLCFGEVVTWRNGEELWRIPATLKVSVVRKRILELSRRLRIVCPSRKEWNLEYENHKEIQAEFIKIPREDDQENAYAEEKHSFGWFLWRPCPGRVFVFGYSLASEN